MVIRIPVHYIAIISGFILCIYSFAFYDDNNTDINVISYEIPLCPLIIDAGHGGADGGAVNNSGIQESIINLEIALKLNSVCHLFGIPTVMIRDSEELEYPPDANTIKNMKIADQNNRLRLIQDYPNGILFSIHQNYYPSSEPKGIQVLYGHDEKSREVGELLQTNLISILCPESRRLAAEIDDNIYLLKHCECVAVLIECGFLSNPTEAELLQTDLYQRKISLILMGSYLQYTLPQRNERNA